MTVTDACGLPADPQEDARNLPSRVTDVHVSAAWTSQGEPLDERCETVNADMWLCKQPAVGDILVRVAGLRRSLSMSLCEEHLSAVEEATRMSA